jgi:hypothetical protein
VPSGPSPLRGLDPRYPLQALGVIGASTDSSVVGPVLNSVSAVPSNSIDSVSPTPTCVSRESCPPTSKVSQMNPASKTMLKIRQALVLDANGGATAMPRGPSRAARRCRLTAPWRCAPRRQTLARAMFLAYTGTRPLQMMRLDPATHIAPFIDGEVPSVFIPAGKGGKSLIKPLPPGGVAAFRLFVISGAQGEFSTSSFYKSWMQACDDAKAERFNPYKLRHSYGTLMRRGGADVADIQALLGHKSPKTTQRYAMVIPEKLAKRRRAFRVKSKQARWVEMTHVFPHANRSPTRSSMRILTGSHGHRRVGLETQPAKSLEDSILLARQAGLGTAGDERRESSRGVWPRRLELTGDEQSEARILAKRTRAHSRRAEGETRCA